MFFVDAIRVLACLSEAVVSKNRHILSFETPSICLAHSRPWPFKDDDIIALLASMQVLIS